MLTQASKVFLPLSGLAFLLALAYGIASGNRDGVLLFLGLMVVAAFAGIVVNAHRENLVGQPVPADAGPPELRDVVPLRPLRGGLWPVLGALALTLLLLGFVLGPLLEENLRRALIISRGDATVFLTRPISAALLALTVAALVVAVLPTIRKRREVVFAEEE